MAKNKSTGKKYAASVGLGQLAAGLDFLQKQLPEIIRWAANELAHRAVDNAQRILAEGGNWAGHSAYTSEITDNISKGARQTNDVMYETGALSDSIHITMNNVAMGSVYVAIGSDLVYAAILEYGGHPFGAVGGAGVGAIPPRPYLRPAIAEAIADAHSWLPAALAKQFGDAITSAKTGKRPSMKQRGGRRRNR